MGLLRLGAFLWLVYMVWRLVFIVLSGLTPGQGPRANPFEPPPGGPFDPFAPRGGRPRSPFEPPGGWYAPPPPPPPPRDPPQSAPRQKSPREVLGVGPAASRNEIREAYQKLIRQYHPDLVSNLGPELRELAEKRTKEITQAYNVLKRN